MKKKVLITLVLSVFVFTIVLGLNTKAIAHPGNSCNPSAGHGRSGCHRVSTSSTTKAKKTITAASKKLKAKRLTAAKIAATKRAEATALRKRIAAIVIISQVRVISDFITKANSDIVASAESVKLSVYEGTYFMPMLYSE